MYIASILTLVALLAAGYVFAKRSRTVAEPRRQADPDSLRLIEQGEVIGFADEHKTHAWLGLPFAQPPLGALRWKAPRPPLAWSGIRDALVFGAFAPQFANITVDAPEPTWGTVVGSEDCLTLNVFAPRFTREQLPQGDARLPVMVWIHGGANTVGTAASYTTLRNVAGQDRVVIISIQYRLGIFGWFSLPEMQEEGDSPEDRSGNFGTLDIIAALKWVKKNSAAFGGNPDNVTIYGESAGAQNVYAMLASPLARGLFHKAILQSPLTTTSTLEQAQNFSDDAIPGDAYSARELFCKWLVLDGSATDRQQAKTLLAHMSPADIRSYLRSRSAAQLLAAIRPGPLGFYPGPRLFRDGTVLPAASMLEVFSERERYNAVPLIIGSNRDEYKLFMTQNPDYVRLLFGKIPIIKDKVRYARHAAYMSDLWKASNVDEPATRMLMSGHQDVWVYRFDWDE